MEPTPQADRERHSTWAVRVVLGVLVSSGVLSALMAVPFVRAGEALVAFFLLAWSIGSFWSAWHAHRSRERLVQESVGRRGGA